MTTYERFLADYSLRADQVTLIPYGSRVYGTESKQSDYDFLAIVPATSKVTTGVEYANDNFNIHVYTLPDFKEQLKFHKIHTLEAYFLPDSVFAKYPSEIPVGRISGVSFKVDVNQLRHELSQKSSHSFVKAKKKIDVERDFYVGWKSLFHSLRILVFGIQLAKDGKITDYSAANHYWEEILQAQQYNWQYFKDKYQAERNRLATEFRNYAPK